MDDEQAVALLKYLKRRLKQCLGFQTSMLEGANVQFDGEEILILCRSLFDRDRLLEIAATAVKSLANRDDAATILLAEGEPSSTFIPDSYT